MCYFKDLWALIGQSNNCQLVWAVGDETQPCFLCCILAPLQQPSALHAMLCWENERKPTMQFKKGKSHYGFITLWPPIMSLCNLTPRQHRKQDDWKPHNDPCYVIYARPFCCTTTTRPCWVFHTSYLGMKMLIQTHRVAAYFQNNPLQDEDKKLFILNFIETATQLGLGCLYLAPDVE